MSQLYSSYHRFSTGLRCMRILWFWKHADKADKKDNKRNAVVGSVIHHLSEAYLKGDIDRSEQMYSEASSFFNDFVDSNYIEWRGRNDKRHMRDAIDQHIYYLHLLYDKYGISPDTCETELPMKVMIGDLKLAGRIDIVLRVDKTRVRVFDLKATENRQNVSEDQIHAYYQMVRGSGLDVIGGAFLLTHFNEAVHIPPSLSKEAETIARMREIAVKESLMTNEMEDATPGRHCLWCEFSENCPSYATGRLNKKVSDHQLKNKETGAIPWDQGADKS